MQQNLSQKLFIGDDNDISQYFKKSKSQMDQMLLGVKLGLIAYVAIITPTMLQITEGSEAIWIPLLCISPFYFMGLAGIHFRRPKLLLTFIIFFIIIGIYAFIMFSILQASSDLNHLTLAVLLYIGMLYILLFYSIKIYILMKNIEKNENNNENELNTISTQNPGDLQYLESKINSQSKHIINLEKKIDVLLLNQQKQLVENNNLQQPVYPYQYNSQNNQIIQSDADQQKYVKQISQNQNQNQHQQQQQQQLQQQNTNYPSLDIENQEQEQQQQQILNSIEASNKQLL